MTKRARAWAPVLVWCALLFGLSCVPGSAIPTVSLPQFDKVVHGVLYLVLGALAARALLRTTNTTTTSLSGGGVIAQASLLAAAYGVSDELHQLFTPRRSSDLLDALADAAGGVVGAWLATTILRRGKSAPAL